MLAAAPVAARRPLQTRRLTRSLSTQLKTFPQGKSAVNHLAPAARTPAYSPRLEPVADRRHQQIARLVEVGLRSRDRVEDPAREQLLARAVEGPRTQHRRDGAAEGSALLAVGDDLRDPLVGAANLLEVGLA